MCVCFVVCKYNVSLSVLNSKYLYLCVYIIKCVRVCLYCLFVGLSFSQSVKLFLSVHAELLLSVVQRVLKITVYKSINLLCLLQFPENV